MNRFLLLTLAVTLAHQARASSHAEAPAIADDPAMDGTDVWAWQDSATTLTIVTAWNGFGTAASGPTYRRWTPKEQGVYEIHIDTDGDGLEDLTYQIQFTDHDNGASTALRVTSPPSYGRLQAPSDPTQKLLQTYSVSLLSGPRRNPSAIALLGTSLPVNPPNAGPQLTWGRLNGKSAPQTLVGAGSTARPGNIAAPTSGADYESQLTPLAIQTLSSGEKTFVGPRADAFFADLGPLSDRITIRTTSYPLPPGAANGDLGQFGGGHNTFAGKNVEVIALQIPIANFGGGFTLPLGGQYVGVWSSSSRREVRVLSAGGSRGSTGLRGPVEVDAGKLVQVSRVGNPFVNTLFIPYDQKDAWNGDEPRNDLLHWGPYFLSPELPVVLNALYNVPIPDQPARGPFPTVGGGSPRNDLGFLFAPDTLKVRIDLSASAGINGGSGLKPSDLAFLGNPLAPHAGIGFSALLGRTPADDVVDQTLQIAAGYLLSDGSFSALLSLSPFSQGSQFPNSALGDGVDFFDKTQSSPAPGSGCGLQILSTFPYLGTPYDGQEARDQSGNGNDDFKTPRHP